MLRLIFAEKLLLPWEKKMLRETKFLAFVATLISFCYPFIGLGHAIGKTSTVLFLILFLVFHLKFQEYIEESRVF
uniref:Putative ovule protein n=1 Tax=Solanum chacoense TaxID=4108 RepID=A0A0V0HLM7_SOLCH